MSIAIIAVIASVIAASIGVFTWLENRSDRGQRRRQTQIDMALHPVDVRLITLEQSASHSPDAIEAALSRALQPLLLQLTDVRAKMDIVWEEHRRIGEGQRQLARDAASVLHHPNPEREKIDVLLDAFMDDTLTVEEEVQLRKYLVTIRNWEPDQDVGFPVYPGEQMAAAILLQSLNHGIGMTPPQGPHNARRPA